MTRFFDLDHAEGIFYVDGRGPEVDKRVESLKISGICTDAVNSIWNVCVRELECFVDS